MSTLKTPVGEQDHIEGNPDAACTLVEYGDFECPHCGAAHSQVKRLQARFGERLRFVFRNFPLSRIHSNAEAAAQVAEFAASHGKFWEMHGLLFEHQNRLGPSLFSELAAKLQLNPTELEEALRNETFERRVRTDFTGGVRSGVNGTPTFFLNGQRYDGSKDFESLSAAIEETMDT